jgi:ABC-type multidrug transport system ATPase subunit
MRCELKGISKRFGRDWILKDIDLDIATGQRLALLGSNGSGKSTLLRIIAGQLGPSKGEIIYHMEGIRSAPDELFAHLSFVAPYIDVYRQFTFGELLDFHFSLKSLRKGFSKEEVIDSIALPSNKALSSFSSGMMQRVKLALAFFSDSQLILFDEPTMNLDDEGGMWFLRHLNELPAGVTVIIASNLPERETSICNSSYQIEGSNLIKISA